MKLWIAMFIALMPLSSTLAHEIVRETHTHETVRETHTDATGDHEPHTHTHDSSVTTNQTAKKEPKKPHGWYAGGGITANTLTIRDYESTSDFNAQPITDAESESAEGFIISGGYRFDRWTAVEINYISFEEMSFNTEYSNLTSANLYDVSLRVVETSVLLILPVNPVEFYVRLGGAYWEGKSTFAVETDDPELTSPMSKSDDGFGYVLGLGMGVNLGRHWHIRAEYQGVGFSSDLVSTDGNLDMTMESMSLELQYRFGEEWS